MRSNSRAGAGLARRTISSVRAPISRFQSASTTVRSSCRASTALSHSRRSVYGLIPVWTTIATLSQSRAQPAPPGRWRLLRGSMLQRIGGERPIDELLLGQRRRVGGGLFIEQELLVLQQRLDVDAQIGIEQRRGGDEKVLGLEAGVPFVDWQVVARH